MGIKKLKSLPLWRMEKNMENEKETRLDHSEVKDDEKSNGNSNGSLYVQHGGPVDRPVATATTLRSRRPAERKAANAMMLTCAILTTVPQPCHDLQRPNLCFNHLSFWVWVRTK